MKEISWHRYKKYGKQWGQKTGYEELRTQRLTWASLSEPVKSMKTRFELAPDPRGMRSDIGARQDFREASSTRVSHSKDRIKGPQKVETVTDSESVCKPKLSKTLGLATRKGREGQP